MSSQAGTTYGTSFVFEDTVVEVFSGSGSPEGIQVGDVGDWYVRSDPGTTAPGARKCSASQLASERSPGTCENRSCPGSLCPTRVRSGPSSPPTPCTEWHPRHPSE